MRFLLAALMLTSLACSSSSSGVSADSSAPQSEDSSQSETGAGSSLFSSSACKKEKSAATLLAHIRTLKVITNESGLAGLRCVAWERVNADKLRVDLYNFSSACGAQWTGSGAVAADGTLNLHVDNPSCLISKCGTCMYDWSFDLDVPVAAGASVPLTISVDTCASSQAPTTWSSQLGPQAKGIHCTLADYGALTWQASATGTCGKAGMPCLGSLLCGNGQFTSTGTCDPGLVCDSSAAPNQPVCLIPCMTNPDCPRTDVLSCQSGLCRPLP